MIRFAHKLRAALGWEWYCDFMFDCYGSTG